MSEIRKKCGLIGNPLGHSWSPQIHSYLGTYSYNLWPMEENEVADFIKKRDFDAINVTIPYKKTVMPYLDRIDSFAKKIGSVNTIVKEEDGSLSGHNTDYFGFSYMLDKGGIDAEGKKVIILGSGGASLTARNVIYDRGAKDIVIISRHGENNYDNISVNSDANIIVNCTPVGMYPKNLVSPVDISIFPDLEGVVDMIYNPGKTRLMLDCEERKVNHISGLSMLVAQAKQASEYFTNKKIDNSVIDEITDKINFKLSNITLIGMPGSGKSTVGKAISEITGRDFIDTDDEIVKKINMPIPEFFSKYGEEKFRDIESEITEKFSKKSGLVISTGGGVVKRQKNIFAIRQNSFVVYLDRDVDSLPKDGRPLSMKNDLRKMKEERLPLYLKAADFTYQVENLNPKINARNILNLIKKRKN